MLDFMKERLSERSTKVGLALLAVQAVKLLAPQWAPVLDFVSMTLGGAAVVTPDKR